MRNCEEALPLSGELLCHAHDGMPVPLKSEMYINYFAVGIQANSCRIYVLYEAVHRWLEK